MPKRIYARQHDYLGLAEDLSREGMCPLAQKVPKPHAAGHTAALVPVNPTHHHDHRGWLTVALEAIHLASPEAIGPRCGQSASYTVGEPGASRSKDEAPRKQRSGTTSESTRATSFSSASCRGGRFRGFTEREIMMVKVEKW